jgi:hypothetical protein
MMQEILQNTLDKYDDYIAREKARKPPTVWRSLASVIFLSCWARSRMLPFPNPPFPQIQFAGNARKSPCGSEY